MFTKNNNNAQASPDLSDNKASSESLEYKKNAIAGSAAYSVQHSSENRNPYRSLLANINTLDVINIYAIKLSVNSLSDIIQSGTIKKADRNVEISLPSTFALAASEIAAELGIPLISSRISSAVQMSLPHAPKPPAVKLKTGKSGASSGFVPEDLATTTGFDEQGMVCAIDQKSEYIPLLNEDIQLVQLSKPLEQVIFGLGKNPSEFILADEKAIENGYLSVKLNTQDVNLKNLIFRYHLETKDDVLTRPIDFSSGRKPIADKPQWWDEVKFGDYAKRAICGYPQEYKKSDNEEFREYRGYGRKGSNGEILPITGDQDLFFIPKSSTYKLAKETAYEVVNVKQEKTAIFLKDQIIETYKSILKQVMQQMIKEGKNNETISNYFQTKTMELKEFLSASDSKKFLRNLGVITPFEALTICKINMRETELKNELQTNPTNFMSKLKHVDITASSGINEIIAKNLDVDLHPSWFEFDAASCIQHVRNQLQANRDISSDILFLYMQALANNKDPNEVTSIRKLRTDNPTNPIITGILLPEEEKENANALAASVAVKVPFIAHKHRDWQIYMKDINGNMLEFSNPTFSFNVNTISDIIFNIPKNNNSRNLIHFSGNQVNAEMGNNEGFKQISKVLTALDFKAEAFYPTVHQGMLLSAMEALRDSQNESVEALDNTDNNQQEHNLFKPK